MNEPSATPLGRINRTSAVMALLLLVPAMSIGNYFVLIAMPGTTTGKIISLIARIWLVAFPLVWWRVVQKQKLSWSPAKKGGFGIAAGLGVLISVIILLAYWFIGRQWIDPDAVKELAAKNQLNRLSIYLLGAVYWVTLNSLAEEYVWRWFVFRHAEVVFGAWPAVIVSALGFTAHHIVALGAYFDWRVTALGSLGVFIGGATWSVIYLRYRSVWPAYLSHAIVDVPIFLIGWHLIFR